MSVTWTGAVTTRSGLRVGRGALPLSEGREAGGRLEAPHSAHAAWAHRRGPAAPGSAPCLFPLPGA